LKIVNGSQKTELTGRSPLRRPRLALKRRRRKRRRRTFGCP
jgi:hypothetical protein